MGLIIHLVANLKQSKPVSLKYLYQLLDSCQPAGGQVKTLKISEDGFILKSSQLLPYYNLRVVEHIHMQIIVFSVMFLLSFHPNLQKA